MKFTIGKVNQTNKVFLTLGHECEMPMEEDPVDRTIPEEGHCSQFRRKLLSSILVDEKICKSCAIHLRSHGAIQREKMRQLEFYRSSIHPFSKLRIWWEFFMLFICLSQLVLVPLDIAYFNFDKNIPFFSSIHFIAFRMFTDLICCFDILINSFTGYYDESKKEIVLNHYDIFIHYLKGKFFLNLLSSIPTHWDLFLDLRGDNFSILKILQCISMLKFLHYYTFSEYAIKIANILSIDFYVRHGALMVITMILFWHGLSCTQLFGYVVFSDKKNINVYNNATPFMAIARSLYDGALLIYTSSYGVSEPENNYEYIMTIFLWFLSKFVQVFLLARIMEYLRAKTSPQMKYSQMLKQLIEFMRHKQLPLYTQKRILSYYEFHFQKSYFRENEIYATISGQLRQEIVMQTCRQLVENVKFFRDLPLNLLIRIVSCLQSEIYLTNDVVIKANTTGNCMYFISTGTVAVYTVSGREVCHLEDGAHFGEIALINKDAQRMASVIAVETCELYRLDRKDFVKAIYPYPDLLEKIEKIAVDRIEKTTLLEEQYKREIASKWLH